MDIKEIKTEKYGHERRKAWKKNGKRTLKTHYVMLVLVMAFAGLIGIENGYNPNANSLSDAPSTVAGQQAAAQEMTFDNGFGDPVLAELFRGDFDEAQKEAKNEIVQFKKEQTGNEVLGRRHGILAGIANDISSGSVMVRIFQAVNAIIGNPEITGVLLVITGLLIYFLVWMFIVNVYRVTMRRMFLEARTYKKVYPSQLLFLKTVGKWTKASVTMLRYYIQLTLWFGTIIGGPIKYYSYWAVPYIVAENPDISAKEAIALSRKIMYEHKWETFKYDVTFAGWYILSCLTAGLLLMFFVAPYKKASDAELFTYLREEAKKNAVEGTEYLNDPYLYEKASAEVLNNTYRDILETASALDAGRVELTAVQKFFSDNFGLWIGSSAKQKKYETIEEEETKIERSKDCVKGLTYPLRLNKLWNSPVAGKPLKKQTKESSGLNPYKNYSVWSVITMFAAFSSVGWCWEVMLHLVQGDGFINRGALHGPWLPIYGAGAVMIVILLKRFRRKPLIEAASALVLCGFLEYFTSFIMEMTKGIRWWDYTGYFLNLNGRICGEGLFVFVVGGLAVVYVAAPYIDKYVQKVKPGLLTALCLIFVTLFGIDAGYSIQHPNVGKGITDYDNYKTGAVEGKDILAAGSITESNPETGI